MSRMKVIQCTRQEKENEDNNTEADIRASKSNQWPLPVSCSKTNACYKQQPLKEGEDDISGQLKQPYERRTRRKREVRNTRGDVKTIVTGRSKEKRARHDDSR